jgi:phage-related tail protein
LVQHHKYTISDIENLMPFERDIYVQMLVAYIKELEQKLIDNFVTEGPGANELDFGKRRKRSKNVKKSRKSRKHKNIKKILKQMLKDMKKLKKC